MPQSNLPVGRRLAAVVAVSCVLATGLSLAGTPPAARATVTPLITLVQQPGSYTRPVLVTNAGDSRLFVVQQTGQIYVAGSTPALFLNLSGQVGLDGGERGLLGLAFDPAYATNGAFYVYYTQDQRWQPADLALHRQRQPDRDQGDRGHDPQHPPSRPPQSQRGHDRLRPGW